MVLSTGLIPEFSIKKLTSLTKAEAVDATPQDLSIVLRWA